MQPSLNWERAMPGSRRARWAKDWFYRPAIGTAIALFAVAALLLWRRLAGAIHEPLPIVGIVFAGVFLALAAGTAHWAGRFFTVERHPAVFSDIALSLSLFTVAAVLSMPDTSTVGLILSWLILLVEEGAFYARVRLPRVAKETNALVRTNDVSPFRQREAPAEPRETAGFSSNSAARQELRAAENAKHFVEIDEELPPEEVSQQFTRTAAADGAEEIAGWLRISFAAGQRTKNAHLAFCPPFARTPQLSVEQLDGPEARIKTAQVLPYGARLDLKLPPTGESSASIVLHFTARAEVKKSEL
jgi:hypothetical protein